MKSRTVVAFGVILILTLSAAMVPRAHSSLIASAYRLHSPIHINGNSGFNFTNGVSSGTGTASDPFIIEALEINGIIGIANTNSFFIIRNMLVNPDPFEFAVSFLDVANGEIANSTFMDSRWGGGVNIQDSTNIIVTGNSASGINLLGNSSEIEVSHNRLAAMLSNGDHVVISQNNFTNGGVTLGASVSSLDTTTITPDNLVNGLPLYYYKDCNNLTVDNIKAGQIIIANCKGVRLTNVQITNSFINVAVAMLYVDSAIVRGNSFNDSGVGLSLQNVNRTTIIDNDFSYNGHGIWLAGDSGFVSNNRFHNNNIGVSVLGTNQTLSDNTVWRNNIGFNLENSNFTVSANTTYANSVGIEIGAGNQNALTSPGTVIGNTVSLNDRVGIKVDSGNGQVIESNNIANNAVGLHIDPIFAKNILFEENNFVSNNFQAEFLSEFGVSSSSTITEGTYPSGGNFWSDYHGVDLCSGPFQNVCTGPDGIGDAPFAPDGRTILDNYPHMLPFGPPDVNPPHWLPESAISSSRITSTSVYLEWLLSTSLGTYLLPGVSGALDNVGVTQFRVLQDGVTVMTVNATFGAALVSGLNPGITYKFKIEAGDTGNNWSVDGPSVILTTLSQSPARPTGSNGTPNQPQGFLATLAAALANPLAYIVEGATTALVSLTGVVITIKRRNQKIRSLPSNRDGMAE